jgi:hypothetical protein
MKCISTAVGVMLLMLVVVAAAGQSSTPKPAPELKKWDTRVGDWSATGTAKDTPTGPEYKVEWHTHCHWILGGFFLETDYTWKGNGVELQMLEIGSYDPVKKIHTVSGFDSSGATWTSTVTFDKDTSFESYTLQGPDGKAMPCRETWIMSSNGMSNSGTAECEINGVRWTNFKVTETKSKTAN